MILVIGATGQLGTATIRKLTRRNLRVRAFVRTTSCFRHLEGEGIELAFGDLLDSGTLDVACAGIDTVIATATGHIPSRGGDNFEVTDSKGYRNLIDACVRHGVRQFIFTSATATSLDEQIPLCRLKRMTEGYLRASGLRYTIFRSSAFMDIHFALLGSELPLAGSEMSTINRNFWFTRRHFNSIRHNISDKSVALIPGNGHTRHSFICVDDVAEFLVRSVGLPTAYNSTIDIGGPEQLSWNAVVDLYREALGKNLREKFTPPFVFRLLSIGLRPFSPAASNIMALNYLTATTETVVQNMRATADLFGVELTSARTFLQGKARFQGENSYGPRTSV